MVRGVGAVAISFLLVSACTTFGTMESPSEDDAGAEPPFPVAPFPTVPPGPPPGGRDAGLPQRDGGVTPVDGGTLTPDGAVPLEAGTGDRRIVLVPMVSPRTTAMLDACAGVPGGSFVPFVVRGGRLPSVQYAPDSRRIVRYDNPAMVVAASLDALQTSGASTTILFVDGGRPAGATHVWTGLAPTAGVGETCGNWAAPAGNGGAGIYNGVGRQTVYFDGKGCAENNTLMVYCVEL